MHLSTVDRLVSKLGPVNALVGYLYEHLLPNNVAHAGNCTGQVVCLNDWGCGPTTGASYATYCLYPDDSMTFMYCNCA